MSRILTFVLLSLFCVSTWGQSPLISGTSTKEGPAIITADWNQSGPAVIPEIRADQAVTLVVQNFNFIHYDLEIKVEEEVVEIYRELDEIFSQLLSIPNLNILGGGEGNEIAESDGRSFELVLVDWHLAILQARKDLNNVMENAPTAKTIANMVPINGFITTIDTALKNIKKFESEAYDYALDPRIIAEIRSQLEESLIEHNNQLEESQRKPLAEIMLKAGQETIKIVNNREAQYKSMLAKSDKIVGELKHFIKVGTLTKNGLRKNLGKKKSGTLVTVSLQPKKRADTSVDGKAASFDYFVYSKFGLKYHLGYTYKSIDDFEFEKIPNPEDGKALFEQTQESTEESDLTAFVSWEFGSYKIGKASLSLGTDVDDSLDKIYAGLSLRPSKRFILNAGVVSGTVTEGDDLHADIAQELGLDAVYGQLIKREDWSGFIGISFSVF